jgi:membrane protease YdiL (CAAX protease family)
MRGGEEKLGRGGVLFLVVCLLVSVASLLIGFRLYPQVIPEASIQFQLDRKQAEERARAFLDDLGLSTKGDLHASRFVYDDEAKVFLERTLGLEAATPLFTQDLLLWRWAHRWFQPLRREEFLVEVATTGEIARFQHVVEEEAPGDSLSLAEARARAEGFLREVVGVPLDGLRFVEGSTEARPHRLDHVLTWEREGWDVEGARLRYEVVVQGGDVGGYRLYLKVPETWTRAYANLRSMNTVTANVAGAFYLLTILLMAGTLVVRIRRRDVRWRPALLLAGLGSLFVLLGGLNGLPNALFGYETTTAFEAFVAQRVGTILLGAIGVGVFLLVLVGGAEPLYRERYPEKLSLEGILTRRVLRTRRFLLSSVLGLTLTCGFFAYQMVFYKVAAGFGAWSPAEVPYNEILNTALPWAFLLLGGFLPAVSEEAIARMFSIPFLTRLFRSRALAVLVPALIWGFAHANYPNQPFYIRGVEVGLVGIFIGIVMLRVNILAPLIWHYTVDALYTGYLLLRSGNPYYVVSAAVVGGLFLLPVLYALGAYVMTRRFHDPRPLLNGTVGTAPPPERVRVATGEVLAPRPVPSRRRWLALGVLAVGAVLVLRPAGQWGRAHAVRTSRGEARQAAARFLASRGVSLDTLKTALSLEDPLGRHDRVYLVKTMGWDAAGRFLAEELPPLGWRLRAFQELREEEFRVGVGAADGRVFFHDRKVAEGAPGDSIGREEAERLARGALRELGVDLGRYELAEIQEEARPARMDHTVIFQNRPGTIPGLGEARLRWRVVLHGRTVDGIQKMLKLPESWVRARERKTLVHPLRIGLLVLVLGAAGGVGIWLLMLGHRAGRVAWGPSFLAGGVVFLLNVAHALNMWPSLLGRYETSIPWRVFVVTLGVGILLGAVVAGLAAALAWGFFQAAFERFREALRPQSRRNLATEAWFGGAFVLGVVLASRGVGGLLERALPSVAVPSLGAFLPAGSAGWIPFVSALFSVTSKTLILWWLLAAAGHVWRGGLGRGWVRWAVALAAAVALVPLNHRTAPEFLAGLLPALILVVGIWWALRLFLRDNPWAYLAAASLVAVVDVSRGLVTSGLVGWRIQGGILILIVLVLLAVFLRGSEQESA